jgi:hypothetical protein
MPPSGVWYAARVISLNMVPFHVVKKIFNIEIKYFIKENNFKITKSINLFEKIVA